MSDKKMDNKYWLEFLIMFDKEKEIDPMRQADNQEYINASLMKCILAINEKLDQLIDNLPNRVEEIITNLTIEKECLKQFFYKKGE